MLPVTKPTLLLDKEKCLRNISRMAEKARRHHVRFRPHFKTHQSHEIGRWFREYGVEAITVSSLSMARYFAADGWNDITVAFPANVHEYELINKLAGKINLNLLVESPAVVRMLQERVHQPLGLFIKVDSGYHRTGVDPSDKPLIDSLLLEIKNAAFSFRGFITHAGHSYKARSRNEIEKIHRSSLEIMRSVKEYYQSKYPDVLISVGDTPSCSVLEDFTGVDEVRPGNFVFYDVTQSIIGSCLLDEVAVCMACPVVSTHRQRNEVVIYGGSVHFSKDSVTENGRVLFGKVVRLSEDGWLVEPTTLFVKSLSQEHGIIGGSAEEIKSIEEGDVLGILPVHSCLTADCMGEYLTTQGEVVRHFRYRPG
ncbi:MAG: alanine racemase [Cyclobacteriaceae bacterium]|nr:alanine racemase [Cyclobacteriaceae bacterium]